MVSKCANPACQTPFRYLHEGRLFNVFDAVPGAAQSPAHASRMELFWLCNACVKTVRIVLQEGKITARPLQGGERASAPDSSYEEEDALVEFC